MTVKGLTKKQLITLLEKRVTNDNACITEEEMMWLFREVADVYDGEIFHGEVVYELVYPNPEWDEIRMFLPRVGDRLKGLRT